MALERARIDFFCAICPTYGPRRKFEKKKISSGTWGHLAWVIKGASQGNKHVYMLFGHIWSIWNRSQVHIFNIDGVIDQQRWKSSFALKSVQNASLGGRKKESLIKRKENWWMRNQGYTHDAWDKTHLLRLVWARLEVSKFRELESEKKTTLTYSCLCEWQHKVWTLENHVYSLWSGRCDIQDTRSVANNV